MSKIIFSILFLVNILPSANCGTHETAVNSVIEIKDKESDVGDKEDGDIKIMGQIVGSEGSRWKTESLNNGIGRLLKDVQILDKETIFGIGFDNKLYKTTNNARKWQVRNISLPENSFISSLYFADESNGSISVIRSPEDVLNIEGFQSWIFSTNDGGRKWQQEFSEVKTEINKVVLDKEKNGWAIGRRIEKKDYIENYSLFLGKASGNAWREIDSPKQTTVARNIYVDDDLNKILVINSGVVAKFDIKSNWSINDEIISLRPPQIAISTMGKSSDNNLYLMGTTGGRHGMSTYLFSKMGESGQWKQIRLNNIFLIDALFLQSGEIIASSLYLPEDADQNDESRENTIAAILHSFDNGETWLISYQTRSVEHFEKLFINTDKNHLLAVGNEGQVLRLSLTSSSTDKSQ